VGGDFRVDLSHVQSPHGGNEFLQRCGGECGPHRGYPVGHESDWNTPTGIGIVESRDEFAR
jgi:hypothetical protein